MKGTFGFDPSSEIGAKARRPCPKPDDGLPWSRGGFPRGLSSPGPKQPREKHHGRRDKHGLRPIVRHQERYGHGSQSGQHTNEGKDRAHRRRPDTFGEQQIGKDVVERTLHPVGQGIHEERGTQKDFIGEKPDAQKPRPRHPRRSQTSS